MQWMRRKEADDCLSIVGATRAPNLVKLGVKQLFKALAAAPHSRVMQLDLEGLEYWKQGAHKRCVSCSLTFELTRPRRQDGLPVRPIMSHGGCAGKAACRSGSG